MSAMFSACSRLTHLNLSKFNTQNVTNMSGMFQYCTDLKTIDLSNFNTQNVIDMSSLFESCVSLTSLDLQSFNTQNVTNMESMFSRCSRLTSLDLRNFYTQKVTNMSYMFSNCFNLTTIYCTATWICNDSRSMFSECTKLKGAVDYESLLIDDVMANPETGYFTAKPAALEHVKFEEDGAQSIYTLQGKRVHEAWKHLPAGVYVINGKKIIK